MALPLRTRMAARAGQAVAAVSRRAHAGEGSVIGGIVLLRIDPRALERYAAGHTVCLVSGTNGKTTTTRLLASALETRGPVTTNSTGANLLSGLVSTLADGPDGGAAVLEVDEALLPTAVARLHPGLVVLLNLSRDQLDRIAETRLHAEAWRTALEGSPSAAVAANAAMAAAGAAAVGVDAADALRAMGSVSHIAGRYQVVDVGGTAVRLLLAKNPAGWAEALELIRPAPMPLVVGINARVADGRDPSWLWDVPFERLQGRLVIATGERGRDLAVRLRYAGVEHRFVDGYASAVRAAGASDLDLAANYSSFQDARRELGRG